MIDLSHVSRRYGEQTVVDDVSLTLAPGRLTAIVGPNGAGKSTLLAMISRLLSPSAGTITVGGMDVQRERTDVLARHLAILRQDNHLPLRLRVRDIVAFGRYPHSRGRLTQADKAHIERAIDYLHLRPLETRYLDQLSGGQRQRAFIAMVLCQDTEYILLDEPLNSLDMKNATDIMHIMRRAVDELGKTVVTVLHDINMASCYADMIVGLRGGRLHCAGAPCDIVTPAVLKGLYDVDVRVYRVDDRLLCMPGR